MVAKPTADDNPRNLSDEVGQLADPTTAERGRQSLWYIRVPIDLLQAKLPWSAKCLHVILLSRCPAGSNQLLLSQIELARALRINRSTLRKHLTILAQSGWVELKRGPRGFTAVVLHNPVLEERHRQLQEVRRRIDRAAHKGEALMREWLNLIVDSQDHSDEANPGFLRNPVTGETLKYDRWYPVGVAFEFNGPQHYGPTDAFPDPDKVRLIMARDYIKIGISQENGIRLVVVRPEDLTFKRMCKKVEGLLPLRQVRPDDPVLSYLTKVSFKYMGSARKGGEGHRLVYRPQERTTGQAPQQG